MTDMRWANMNQFPLNNMGAQDYQASTNDNIVQSSPMLDAHPSTEQAFGGPFPTASGSIGESAAQGSEADPLFFLGRTISTADLESLRPPRDSEGQLIAPDPSQSPCFAELCGVHVPTHQDYGLTPHNCRTYGAMARHKGLAVFCLVCREPLPSFDVRCESCKTVRSNQVVGNLEARSCIICKFHTTYFDTIFCEYHMTRSHRFSHAEHRILERAGICNMCWQVDVSEPGLKTCDRCKNKRNAQYRIKKKREQAEKAFEK